MRLTFDTRRLHIGLVSITVVIALGLLLVQIPRAPETHPWGDTAITSITTLRAARGELATGAYSRFHWNHPGPLLYQMLAPLYVLSGEREISIKWTVLMLNIGALDRKSTRLNSSHSQISYAVFCLKKKIARRAQLRWRGLAFVARKPEAVAAPELLRLDTCWSVATGLALVDMIQSADFHARQLMLALDSGVLDRITRAMALEAMIQSGAGGPRRAYVVDCLARAETLASQSADAYGYALCFFFRGAATTEIYTLSLHDALPI